MMERLYPINAPARHYDRRFELPAGAFDFCDILSPAAEKLRQIQLLDRGLWKLLTALFRCPGVDDADHGWRCEYWGKMMRGACFMYKCAPAPDEELYAVLEESVRDLLDTQDGLGRISTYSVACEFHGWDLWGRKYVMLGLLYCLELCRDEALRRRIVAALTRHADYILSKIGPEEGKLVLPACTDHWDGLNSCSILEPFVLLYNLTREPRYLRFCDYIVSYGGTLHQNLFDAAYRDELEVSRYHTNKAYEMISCFDGLAEYIKVTGSEYYRQALLNFGRRVLREEATIIGCLGCQFEQFDHASVSQFDAAKTTAMQETCVTVTWMKFLWQLWRITGEAVYMDALESSAYNAMAAAIKRHAGEPRNGGIPLPIHSYNPLRHAIRFKEIGGQKSITPQSDYGCCVCISSAGFALDTLAAAGYDREGTLYINLYRNGSIRFDGMTVQLSTDYPATGAISVSVSGGAGRQLAFRVPGWAHEFRIAGADFRLEAGYAYVALPGDVTFSVEIGLPVRFLTPSEAADIPVSVTNYLAVLRGPQAFAYDETQEIEPVLPIRRHAKTQFRTVGGPASRYALHVALADGRDLTLVDYPSAGQEEGHKVCAWLKTEA